MELQGRSVLVTGAGRGLGLAIARRVGHEGATVWIADVRPEWGEPAASQLQSEGVDARFVEVDVADPLSVDRMAHKVTAASALYGLVNNAALADNVGGKVFYDIDVADWDRITAVNMRGPWLVARAVVRSMISAGEGRILNIASDAAIYGSPRLAHYIATKGALLALTRAMTRELGPDGITVNSIAPGITQTESTEEIPAARHELYRLNRAIQRAQQPSDIVGAAAFLLGPEASYITGQTLVVNGGFVLH